MFVELTQLYDNGHEKRVLFDTNRVISVIELDVIILKKEDWEQHKNEGCCTDQYAFDNYEEYKNFTTNVYGKGCYIMFGDNCRGTIVKESFDTLKNLLNKRLE